jgi:LysR family transcriptional regulator, glycine cleavage system transcriptional activator
MKRDAPSFAALRAFTVAARRQSFRDAGLELGVTPSAVSHQVRALEDWVGAPLFVRQIRQVRLTPLGETLSVRLSNAFGDIDAALGQMKRDAIATRLRIAALPLFTNVWLVPRLARFETLHPELSLSIDTHARVVDLQTGEADVAIRNVAAVTTGLFGRKLLDLRATPLCTPDIARSVGAPKDLARATLIDLSIGRAGWAEWFDAVGCKGLKPKRMLTFDNVPSAIDAAAQGRGVLLGLLPLVFDAPNASTLVAPIRHPPQDAGAYFAVCRKEDRSKATVQAFMQWLAHEMRGDLSRLRQLERARLTS